MGFSVKENWSVCEKMLKHILRKNGYHGYYQIGFLENDERHIICNATKTTNPYVESPLLEFDIYTDNFFEFCEQLMQQVREKKLMY